MGNLKLGLPNIKVSGYMGYKKLLLVLVCRCVQVYILVRTFIFLWAYLWHGPHIYVTACRCMSLLFHDICVNAILSSFYEEFFKHNCFNLCTYLTVQITSFVLYTFLRFFLIVQITSFVLYMFRCFSFHPNSFNTSLWFCFVSAQRVVDKE